MKYRYLHPRLCTTWSRPARGAWVEIKSSWLGTPSNSSRAPQGARGLKFLVFITTVTWIKSRPARGAWVEMLVRAFCKSSGESSRPARGAWVEIKSSGSITSEPKGRAPQGARGLKSPCGGKAMLCSCRAPQGARGLKCKQMRADGKDAKSRPARGAWVEIAPSCSWGNCQ